MRILGYDENDKRFVSVPTAVVATGLALVVGAGGGVLLGGGDESDSAGERAQGSAGAASAATPCLDAVDRADVALAEAAQVDDTLAAHTEVMNDLIAQRITAEQATARTVPLLTTGSQHSVQLDIEAQRFRQAAEACRG